MKLFFSGVGKPSIEEDPRLGIGKRYRLFSCHGNYFTHAVAVSKILCELSKSGVQFEVMYDSGAFTAWSQGKEVDIDELEAAYDALIEQVQDYAEHIWLINLDKIPGSPGRTASDDELAEAIVISQKNFERLEKRYGHRVLPVFHQNESESHLLEVASAAEYICVSPRNDVPEKQRVLWSKEVHSKIANRTHGLAATGKTMMTAVPWHSVDSATWVMVSAYGHMYIDTSLKLVTFSSASPARKEWGKHYDTLPHPIQEKLLERLDSKGFTLELVQESFVERAIWNRLMMTELYEGIVESKPLIQQGLFPL